MVVRFFVFHASPPHLALERQEGRKVAVHGEFLTSGIRARVELVDRRFAAVGALAAVELAVHTAARETDYGEVSALDFFSHRYITEHDAPHLVGGNVPVLVGEAVKVR